MALQLLEQAGYQLKGGKLVNAATGEPFQFEIFGGYSRPGTASAHLRRRPETDRNLEARIRQVDSAQYQRRKQTYDF